MMRRQRLYAWRLIAPSPHRPVALSPSLHAFIIIKFLCDRYQRQAARRADQTFELEQRHEEVCEIGLSRRDVIVFEQPPVDERGQSRDEAEKFHFAHDEAGLLQLARQFAPFVAAKMTEGAIELAVKKLVRRHEQRQI